MARSTDPPRNLKELIDRIELLEKLEAPKVPIKKSSDLLRDLRLLSRLC